MNDHIKDIRKRVDWVKGQGPTKVIMVCDTPPYGHARTYQISLTYLERNNYLTLRSKDKVPQRSLRYVTHHLIGVICDCFCILVSNTYCVMFSPSSCIPYVASFSVLFHRYSLTFFSSNCATKSVVSPGKIR